MAEAHGADEVPAGGCGPVPQAHTRADAVAAVGPPGATGLGALMLSLPRELRLVILALCAMQQLVVIAQCRLLVRMCAHTRVLVSLWFLTPSLAFSRSLSLSIYLSICVCPSYLFSFSSSCRSYAYAWRSTRPMKGSFSNAEFEARSIGAWSQSLTTLHFFDRSQIIHAWVHGTSCRVLLTRSGHVSRT
jgi:hypothetical protein